MLGNKPSSIFFLTCPPGPETIILFNRFTVNGDVLDMITNLRTTKYISEERRGQFMHRTL